LREQEKQINEEFCEANSNAKYVAQANKICVNRYGKKNGNTKQNTQQKQA
jgi:hypothetical protein